GALSATWGPEYRDLFGPLVPGFSHVPFNKPESLDAAITAETAAFIFELVQGEGGVRPASREFAHEAARLCAERGALLIVDEIQRLDLARNARERGAQLVDGLRDTRSDRVREVRGLGLLVGVELKENAAGALRALQEEGVLALGAGPTVVRFLPPLVITADQIDRVLAASAKALG